MLDIDQFRNKILYGDCLEVLKTLPSNSIQMCVTSPPYFNLREYHIDGQVGHETTPEEFVKKLVVIFNEVKRVLRPDGVCFLNMGDSYWNSNGFERATNGWHRKGRDGAPANDRKLPKHPHLKQKDLCLVPQRLELALQEDGWYIRNDIVWWKPNPIPFPVTDRLVNCHETIILMTKSSKCFYDAYAVKEPVAGVGNDGAKRNKRDVWFSKENERISVLVWILSRLEELDPELPQMLLDDYIANNNDKTDVWNVTVKGTKEAHFATFNPELITPTILAGTSEKGACPVCGAPYKRIIEKGDPIPEWKANSGADSNGGYNGKSEKFLKQDALGKATQTGFNARWKAKQQNASDVKRRILEGMVATKTLSWEPTCDCNKQMRIDTDNTDKNQVPCVVLDPFMGSGTTAIVAQSLGRDYIGIDLNKDYIEMAERRIVKAKQKETPKKQKENNKRFENIDMKER